MKKIMSPKRKEGGEINIKIVSSLHLSPKERIEVLDISGERIVVGIAPGSINYLTKLNRYKEGYRNIENAEKEREIK
jgi:flagellar biogenesis protein FliO